MAGNIKGITIEFNGDTTKLDKALRQVNNETRAIDKELNQVNKALKFNPQNVDLLRQKQTLLNQKITETKSKLDVLKQAQAKMDAEGVDKNSAEYRELQREIITTESKLKTFEAQVKKVDQTLRGMDMQKVSDQFKSYGENLTKAGQAMAPVSAAAAGVVAGLGAISYKAGVAADDLNTLSKVSGIGTGELQKYGYAADLVDVSVEAIAKSSKKLGKNAFEAANGSKSQAEAFDALGVSVTDSNGELRDSDDIFQDTITALGKMTNETERDALAQKLMGKSASELNPLIEDGGETYKMVSDTLKKYNLDYIDQETLDKANAFNDSIDTMKLLGSVAFAQVGSQLASVLAPALEKVVNLFGRFAEWLGNLNPKVLAVIGVVATVVAGIAPVLLILGKIAFAISSITGLMSTLGLSFGAIAGPVGIAIAVIAALIAIGVLLYKNWDKIKAKAIEIQKSIIATWNNIKVKVVTTVNNLKSSLATAWATIKSTASSAWKGVKDAITKPIQTAKDKISGIIDKIKGFFPINIGRIMENLKLPHFKLSGKFSLKDMTVPKLSVDWYAKGGIFNSPTIAGIGDVRGGEAVVPLDKFWNKLDNMSTGGDVYNFYITGDDPKKIAKEVKQILINDTKRNRLAWQ
jgi:phage-related minor tail protein